ncbi:efflux RND transporter periplasmic adaptor subunit [Tissierellaceae bacterium BX21]|jgi:multidrug resistance efflux pump|uniref:Efflux RND transporter periplasmic adaptor subunit n=1 Tax=Paratissierella segnis TaxID=2763679 RepID=A0A926EV56_9FIRM|nr:efflux RND transporter periplasmic adaptor subunit [Paratissierella segnis]MBC8589496.1 efflux RND transporter periplasmic adaptor subunit [Paratissierella segnis]
MKNWILSHKKTVIIGVCVLAVILTISVILLHRKNTTPVSQIEGEQNLTTESQEINVWGEVKCTNAENINIDFPAFVTDVLIKEGDRVTLGQPLVTLDLTEYNGTVEKLKQQLTANEAALPATRQDVSALQADIDQMQQEISRKKQEYNNCTNSDLKLLQNNLELAQRELVNAQNDLKNYKELYDTGAISKEMLNKYEDALEQRQKALNDVQENIQKAKLALKDELNQLDVGLKAKQVQLSQLKAGNTASVTEVQSGISSAQVDLDLMISKTAKNYINENQIVSNLNNGIVQSVTINNGDHLGTQGTPTKILQIVDMDSITVSAEVDEEFISSVEVGDTVRIVPTYVPDVTIDGTVMQIPELAVEKDGKRIVRVLVKPNDPDEVLKPGYTTDVYFKKS